MTKPPIRFTASVPSGRFGTMSLSARPNIQRSALPIAPPARTQTRESQVINAGGRGALRRRLARRVDEVDALGGAYRKRSSGFGRLCRRVRPGEDIDR